MRLPKISKFEAEGRELLKQITRRIYSNSAQQFLKQNHFLSYFLRSSRLEKLEFKLEKIMGIQKHVGKGRKVYDLVKNDQNY